VSSQTGQGLITLGLEECHKMAYLVMLRKAEKWSWIHILHQISRVSTKPTIQISSRFQGHI